jgi:hypothetical protein
MINLFFFILIEKSENNKKYLDEFFHKQYFKIKIKKIQIKIFKNNIK